MSWISNEAGMEADDLFVCFLSGNASLTVSYYSVLLRKTNLRAN